VTTSRQVAGAHLEYHFLPVSDTEHQGQDNQTSNKRQSEVVQRKNMKTFNALKTILD
jgi:hypothetical protein